jgi:hypothetical protein
MLVVTVRLSQPDRTSHLAPRIPLVVVLCIVNFSRISTRAERFIWAKI